MNYFEFKPTPYTSRDGRRTFFRSRLEARWAIYFDLVHIEWEYEPEQFKLKDSMPYTPDFRLKELCWIEVKPEAGAIDDTLPRAIKFSEQRSEKVLFLVCPGVNVTDVRILNRRNLKRIEPVAAVRFLSGQFGSDLLSANSAMRSANRYRFDNVMTAQEVMIAGFMKDETFLVPKNPVMS